VTHVRQQMGLNSAPHASKETSLKYLLRSRIGSPFLLIFFTTALALASIGCRDDVGTVVPVKPTGSKIEPTKAERIALVTRILTERYSLPSDIIDAHFDQHTFGPPDPSGLAPEDYVSYMYIRVSTREIGKWDSLLIRPLGYAPTIDPADNYAWWLNGKDMKNFEYFEPQPLASRDGWVAISRKTGELWIYGFTM
jgi:hypothetical protein